MARSPLVDRLRASAPQISVGVLTADWLNLGSQLQAIESAGVELLHFDVMDGVFCPMLTLGAPVVAGLKTQLLKDVHLMIEDPLSKVEGFVAAGADIITLHVESTRHIHRVLQAVGKLTNANDPNRGIVRGIALNPGTPLEVIDPLLGEFEMVLLLAVNPGWGGQKFIASTCDRVKRVREMVRDTALICVDGGITKDNIANISRLGADIIVTGSAVFDGKSPFENAKLMMDSLR
ncbi:ribulose-phosphate 3-epimerase [Steroidobacter sp.]|uniref:ribulose-phosphate 3-epimerase n=1 Tax=Steroidobacter sp. TaxID=1978227 RepID=UPI001A4A3D81|nr:ribulose-phosphate 3-epimerase [Steroidobacter sp.]MBL8270753.1 ribulose-phosphate 3-epimerase [Steroidobacter sp.]